MLFFVSLLFARITAAADEKTEPEAGKTAPEKVAIPVVQGERQFGRLNDLIGQHEEELFAGLELEQIDCDLVEIGEQQNALHIKSLKR